MCYIYVIISDFLTFPLLDGSFLQQLPRPVRHMPVCAKWITNHSKHLELNYILLIITLQSCGTCCHPQNMKNKTIILYFSSSFISMFSILWNTKRLKVILKTVIHKNNRNTEGENEALLRSNISHRKRRLPIITLQ